MSSRQLRKIQQQRELERATASDARDSDSENSAEEAVVSKPRQNLFAAFGDEGEVESQGDDDDEVQGEPAMKDEEKHRPSPSSVSRKSKQKKKNKAKAPAGSSEREAGHLHGSDSEEFDKAIAEIQQYSRDDTGSAAKASIAGSASRLSGLLGVNSHKLRAINEMRSLFGRDVVDSANAEEAQQAGAGRRRGPAQQEVDLETFLRIQPGEPKLPEMLRRRNVFVQGGDHWPRDSAGGLTMQEIKKAPDDSWTEYAFVHDKNYDNLQTQFFYAVMSGQPMNLVYSLKKTPYHVSTLLQVSSIAKQDQNMALAAELCERALFTFGRVTTSSFRQDMEHGRARLDFRRPENRQFWLAGYHYLKSLVRKGTYRTALEWARLLFALDFEDPFAMRHFIHFLAIKAFEPRWLINFLDAVELEGENRDLIYLRQTIILAKLQLGDEEGAKRCLVEGIQRLPWLYCSMFQELNLDAPPSIWGVSANTDSRAFWVKLYLYQTKDLWANRPATRLLQQVAKELQRVDAASLPQDDPPPDPGVTRLAYLEGDTSLLAVAPRFLLESQPNFDFDPLPPPEEDNIFTGRGTQLPWSTDTDGENAGGHGRNRRPFGNPFVAQGPQDRPGLGPLGMFGQDDEEDDDEVRALRRADDEELQRDLAAYANRANEPGMLGALMQMLGIVGRDGTGTEHGRNENETNQDDGDADRTPGAWPSEENGNTRQD